MFWGDPLLQGLHIGLFIALAALVSFWIIINRTTLGYEVRAVGFNPEAARYGGISVARNYFLAMAIAGVFAGLAGAIDMLGWRFSIGFSDIQTASIGFVGIAVALLGRNTAVGVGLAALVFGALLNGTASRNIPPEAFDIPEQAGNLSLTIQALVLLFIGADILILYLWAKAGPADRGRAGVARMRRKRRSPSARSRGGNHVSPTCPLLPESMGNLPVPHIPPRSWAGGPP